MSTEIVWIIIIIGCKLNGNSKAKKCIHLFRLHYKHPHYTESKEVCTACIFNDLHKTHQHFSECVWRLIHSFHSHDCWNMCSAQYAYLRQGFIFSLSWLHFLWYNFHILQATLYFLSLWLIVYCYSAFISYYLVAFMHFLSPVLHRALKTLFSYFNLIFSNNMY